VPWLWAAPLSLATVISLLTVGGSAQFSYYEGTQLLELLINPSFNSPHQTVIGSHRDILRDVQGSNVWSGQQVQSFNSDAIAWGALGKPLYATGTRYGVRVSASLTKPCSCHVSCSLFPTCWSPVWDSQFHSGFSTGCTLRSGLILSSLPS
jgi:hypothetical protein